jgi:hypothetical protein
MAKFKPSDRIAVHKRGKPSQYGTVYKIGENKAHGYYYIDFDNGDRLLVGEKELAAANPPPETVHKWQIQYQFIDTEIGLAEKTFIPENWECGCTKCEANGQPLINELHWWESENKD